MDQSPNLELPYISPAQAQKHVTHNEALQILDVVIQASVKSTELGSPPTEPERGDRYIISNTASGDWSGKTEQIAAFQDGGWIFVQPALGWLVHDQNTNTLLQFTDDGWTGVGDQIANSISSLQNLLALGVGTTADATNKIAVSSQASLFTHAGDDHRLVINKAEENDTAAFLLQSNYNGHAEIGLTGSNDLAVKVSADGSNFIDAINIDRSSGKVSFPEGLNGITPSDFGEGAVTSVNYIASRGTDLVTNGTGLLGNNYNFPGFVYDAEFAPNLPGSFSYAGYGGGVRFSTEFIPVNPNSIYQIKTCIREEGYNHLQYVGIAAYDVDQNSITAATHMRYRHGGADSYTTLAAPLSPGDTNLAVDDAAGWNETATSINQRGLIIFEYKNSFGFKYDHYSRIYEFDLFDIGGVNKATNTITLNKPLPVSMGNPDDPNGTWPIGTRIANSANGGTYKYALANAYRAPTIDQWHSLTNHIGGIDTSGNNIQNNFPPGSAFAKLLTLPNYSNRSGGWSTHPDSGANHRVWFGGLSIKPDMAAKIIANANGSKSIKLSRINATGTAMEVVNSSLQQEVI